MKQKVFIFFLLAALIPLIKFILLPEVVIATHTSPLLPTASICLEKIYSNPKSFPIAVIAEVSVVKAIDGNALLFFLNLTVNSVAKCCASAALPPLPKKIIFLFCLIASILSLQSKLKFLSRINFLNNSIVSFFYCEKIFVIILLSLFIFIFEHYI